MKKLFLIGIVLFYSSVTNAQDTIVKRNGDQIISKIIEITSTEVKYKKFDFQDGPNFIENKSDVQLIKYSNGTKDEFEIQLNSNAIAPNGNNTNYNGGLVNQKNKIEADGNRFRYQGKRIDEKELHRILLNSNDQQIISFKNNARRYKKLQLVGLGGLAFGAAGAVSFAAAELFNENAFIVIGGICLGVAIPLPIISLYFKHKRNISNTEAIKLYNAKF